MKEVSPSCADVSCDGKTRTAWTEFPQSEGSEEIIAILSFQAEGTAFFFYDVYVTSH